MGVLLVDGCEDISGMDGSGSVTIVGGRTLKCFSLGSSVASGFWQFSSSGVASATTALMGAAVRWPTLNDLTTPMSFGGLTNIAQLGVVIRSDGRIQVMKNGGAGNTTLGTTAAGVFPANAWVYLEFRAVHHATAGAFTVRMNNTVVLDVSGVNTIPVSNASAAYGYANIGGGSGGWNASTGALIDDVYVSVDPVTFFGDCVVETLYPDGNGAVSGWIGSDGDSVNNYLLVNEVGSVNTGNYTKQSVSGTQDLYTLANMASAPGPIYAVCHAVSFGKSDTGPASAKIISRATTIAKSAAYTIPATSLVPYHYTQELNPDTGLAWTQTDVNNLQTGVEIP